MMRAVYNISITLFLLRSASAFDASPVYFRVCSKKKTSAVACLTLIKEFLHCEFSGALRIGVRARPHVGCTRCRLHGDRVTNAGVPQDSRDSKSANPHEPGQFRESTRAPFPKVDRGGGDFVGHRGGRPVRQGRARNEATLAAACLGPPKERVRIDSWVNCRRLYLQARARVAFSFLEFAFLTSPHDFRYSHIHNNDYIALPPFCNHSDCCPILRPEVCSSSTSVTQCHG